MNKNSQNRTTKGQDMFGWSNSLVSGRCNKKPQWDTTHTQKNVIPSTDINKLPCVGGNVTGYNHSKEKVSISSKNENIPYNLPSNCTSWYLREILKCVQWGYV